LISKRVYRDAWSQEDALALLRREAGTAFDPDCVEALARVVEKDATRASVPRPAFVAQAT
jgi:HD-GYP domain-containing protein (c-di-GMP phosphodiesterase class II)